MLPGKTPQTCDDACANEEMCVDFAIGRADGPNSGECYLHRVSCTTVTHDYFDLYTSGKVNPSKAANVCTHIQ